MFRKLISQTYPLALIAVIASSASGCVVPEVEENQGHGFAGPDQSKVPGFWELEKDVTADESPDFPQPVAELSNSVDFSEGEYDVSVEVYRVLKRDSSTLLTWSIKLNDDSHMVDTSVLLNKWCSTSKSTLAEPFNSADNARNSASSVTLLVEAEGREVWPWQRPVGNAGQSTDSMGCICSGPPEMLGDQRHSMTSLYPALSEPVKSVSLKLPDFGVIRDIPVSVAETQ